MKTYALFIMMNALIVSSSHGKIKNGYAIDIEVARKGFNNLTVLLATDKNLTLREKNRVKRNLNKHRDFILYFELTERLLIQFKMVARDIYDEIDTIKDAKKRTVDVYVKFLPVEGMIGRIAGSTNIPTGEDEDAYSSKYGLHTASVRIVSVKDALILLAHEFGHILHQVPNIAAYRRLYTSLYNDKAINAEETGHHHTDPSGLNASRLEKRFRLNYAEFLKDKNNTEANPLTLIGKISNNL